MAKPDLSNYKEVSERIQDFRQAHPEGTLQSEILPTPVEGFVVVKAYAYRTADDPTPGVGLAWEPVPGATPYTRDSELMNAETSAWGRAIIAVGASDATKVASRNEVRNRQSKPQPEPEGFDVAGWAATAVKRFEHWDDDRRRNEWKVAIGDLFGGEQPKSEADAEKVIEAMSRLYVAELPDSEAPFE